MRIIFYCISLLLLGNLPLLGQGGSGSGKPDRSAWFACTSKPDGLEDPVKVLCGEEITELELPEFMASDAVKVPEDGIVRIVREVPDPGDPSKIKYLVLAKAEIPAGVREALIILVPLPEPKGDLLFQAGVQDLSKFKGGDRMFINMSDTNIGVQIGGSKVSVPAKRSEIYKSPSLDKPTNMPIAYRFYHPEREEWKLLSASTVVLRPTRREICIFNNGSRIGNIKKHKILFPLPIESPNAAGNGG